MIGLGEHAGFILAAYGIVTVAVAALIGWIVFDTRRQKARLDALAARGLRRRSETGAASR